MEKRALREKLAAATVLIGGLLCGAAPAAAEPPRLLLLPFEVSAPQPLAGLKEALAEVLASRIGLSADVVVFRGETERSSPTDLARSAGAGYVLSGRFTQIGDRFSLDAALHDAGSGRVLERYSAEGEGASQVIPKMGDLAHSVGQRFAAVAAAAPRASEPDASPAPAPDKTWVSRPLPMELRGIGLGAVAERGRNDIVVLTRSEVYVYRRQGDDLHLVTRYAANRTAENIGIDVADLDGDGLAEIYVTATAPGNSLASYVLQWSGAGLRPLASDLPWHLRFAELAEGPALIGQRRGSERFFEGPIRRLSWQGGKLVPGEALRLPPHVSLYSFAVADVDGDGRPEVISLQSRTPLMVYDQSGGVLRRGASYGQSALYVVEKREKNDTPEEESELPGRLRTVSIPGRGAGLLAARNHESLGMFHRLRTFTGGEIVALRWEQDQLAEVWRTQPLAYVADFHLASLEPGGPPMLVIATVSDFEGMVSAPRSHVVLAPLVLQ